SVTGQSFFPQLCGMPGTPREWVYCWYFRNGKAANGGKKHTAGEFARNLRYKLYHTGEFYDLDSDRSEQMPLSEGLLSEDQQAVRSQLQDVLNSQTRKGFYKAKN
ncbi:MAG: hypothetical protein ACPGXX_17655, partial [Planctomycetaceae bacterium]